VTDATPKLTGRVPRERIRTLAFERLTRETLDAFAALADLTGTVSDALDNLGLTGAIAASKLRPSLPAARVVGQAVTVRNVERQQSVFRSAGEKINRMGESEAYNSRNAGDVVVIRRPRRACRTWRPIRDAGTPRRVRGRRHRRLVPRPGRLACARLPRFGRAGSRPSPANGAWRRSK
jgi:hypothetical protein